MGRNWWWCRSNTRWSCRSSRPIPKISKALELYCGFIILCLVWTNSYRHWRYNLCRTNSWRRLSSPSVDKPDSTGRSSKMSHNSLLKIWIILLCGILEIQRLSVRMKQNVMERNKPLPSLAMSPTWLASTFSLVWRTLILDLMFLSISTAASSSWLEIIRKERNKYVSMRNQSECLALKQYEIPLENKYM